MILYLVLLITLIDIFSPVLIQNSMMPDQLRWISHGINVILILFLLLKAVKKQISFHWINFIFLYTAVGGFVAVSNGQNIVATIWGWWMLFRYPMIGLAVACSPYRTDKNITRLKHILLIVLLIEVLFQIFQYFGGQETGDNLSGTFGDHGTAKLLFVFLVALSIFLGEWITSKKTLSLIATLILGAVASVLGEMKMFYFAIPAMGGIGLFFYLKRQKVNPNVVLAILSIGIVLVLFPSLIDRFVYNQRSYSMSFLEQMTDVAYLQKYSTFVEIDRNGNYDIGRNYGLLYVWKDVSSDPLRLLIGDGLGSRGQSDSLGSVGVQIQRGDLGLFTGSSLVVFIGEFGILGIVGLIVFLVFTITLCFKSIRWSDDKNMVGIAYGVVIFTLCWPVWLWYTTAWTLPGSMSFYWLLWGVSIRFSLLTKRKSLAAL